MRITFENLSKEQKIQMMAKIKTTIIDNPFIPISHERPFENQVYFLTYESEELLYGGMAGGGKSDALLMSALQYVGESDYSALILRRTFKDLSQPNAIMDRARRWLSEPVSQGIVHHDKTTKTWTFPSGATLTFGYLAHDNDLDQYQGSELQFVGFDELTQFTERQYTYLHSRLRKLKNSNVPIRMRGATNPGGRGHDWVKARFIMDNSPCPFIQSAYTDNLYLDVNQYEKQLDKLDELTKKQLKEGDWNAVISSGLLMNRTQYNKSLISYETFKDWTPVYTVIGIDPASTGNDKFAMACLSYFNNGKIVLVDLDATPDQDQEIRLRNFILRNQQWLPRCINFEREAGSSPHFAMNYWGDILGDLARKIGFYVTDTPASSTGSKYNRAYPVAYHIRNGTLFINEDIPTINVHGQVYDPVSQLGNQFIYTHPDKVVMNDYPSPDEEDAVSYAFEKLNESISGLMVTV